MTAGDIPLWERKRHWELMRPFVYYLLEDFAPPASVQGKRAVDFSAGLGDLTRYLLEQGAASVIATVPEPGMSRPSWLPADAGWRSGVVASEISSAIEPESVDLFCARMVFQFPTDEYDHIDVDGMLDQVHGVLAENGRLIVAAHSFFPLQEFPSLMDEADSDRLLTRLSNLAAEAESQASTEIHSVTAKRVRGLVEMVRYLDLPPREGFAGETGYGLKEAMLSDSFIHHGFEVEIVEDVEPYTYPLGIWERMETDPDTVRELGKRVFQMKQRHLTSAAAGSKYDRPGVLRNMVREHEEVVPLVWVPIVRIVGRKL